MNITITSTPDAFEAAAAVLVKSLNRGDFDDADDGDFEYAAGEASGRFAQAFHDADSDEDDDLTEAVVDGDYLDEILAVIESDRTATTRPLARFIADANHALDTSS